MKSVWSVALCILMGMSLTGCDTLGRMGKSMEKSVSSLKMPKIGGETPAISTVAPDGSLISVGGEGCPQIRALPDLAAITQFSTPKAPVPDKMISTTKLDKIESHCTLAANAVTVEAAFDFSGTLGPVGVKDLDGQANYTYPYFLAVVTPDGKILSKDVFALSMIYENGQITFRRQDKLRQVIPFVAGKDASQYKIMIGFQLSEDELAYNRTPKTAQK